MRAVVITTIFPNAVQPTAGTYNRQQLGALGEMCELEGVAPIPWFPGSERWMRAELADIPRREVIAGLEVEHPRTLYIPKIGRMLYGPLMTGSLIPSMARFRGRVDVVLGCFAYPDGWASIALAKWLGVPCVVKLHGSDVNVLGQMRGPRIMLKSMLPRAERVVAVSRALADGAHELGVPRDRIDVVHNGVDRKVFRPRDRAAARRALGLREARPLIAYIGNLRQPKGVLDLLRAFGKVSSEVPQAALVVVGDGPAKAECEKLARPYGDRVKLVGARPHTEIAQWMAACDILCLPSYAEGTPNVVIEALASGRRVVASDVGGIPDILTSPAFGTMVPPRNLDALARALVHGLREDYDPHAVSAEGPFGDWNDSAASLHAVLERAISDFRQRGRRPRG